MSSAGGDVDFAVALRTMLGEAATVSERQCALLRGHFELLMKWNRRINLTAIRDPSKVIERHYCESVFLAEHLPTGTMTVVDVGSGAGFPGIGVAVMRPYATVDLIESNGKKAAFLKESARAIPNVRVLGCRAERLLARYDWLVSRAVAWEDLPLLADHIALLAVEPGPEFHWRERIRLPWGERRVLLIGDVPRETGNRAVEWRTTVPRGTVC
jgi:16S rRNA (guanine(527)-N(7))-methyltransferase RsmG